MNRTHLLLGSLILVANLTFLGCGGDGGSKSTSGGSSGPGNQNAYQEGSNNCSSDFVYEYNKVITEFSFVRGINSLNSVESMVNDFSAKYAGVQCTAKLHESGHLSASTSSINVNSKVAEWRSAIAKARGTLDPSQDKTAQPLTPQAPITVSDSKSAIGEIKMVIVDADAFNEALSLGFSALFQAGKEKSFTTANRSVDFCYLQALGRTKTFSKGDTVIFNTSKDENNRFAGVSKDETIVMGCARVEKRPQDWTILDLQNAFEGIVTVELKK